MSTFSFSRLLSNNVAQQPSQILTFSSSPHDPSAILVHRANIPICSITISEQSKPNLHISRLASTGQPIVIGNATLHTLSSTIDLSLHGQTVQMKPTTLSTGFKLTHPRCGTLTWEHDKMTGTKWELRDSSGMKLARIKTSMIDTRCKEIEVLVPCEEWFVDLIILSGTVVQENDKKGAEVASELFQAVAGV